MNSKILMVVSIIVLGLTVAGLMMSIQAPPSSAHNAQQVESPVVVTYDVWVAREALVPGDLVERQNLQLQRLDQQDALNKGVRSDINITFTPAMVANARIESGQIVFPENITHPDQDGYFSLVIEPGFVPLPITIPADAVVGGVIQSGSVVDILALSSLNQNLAYQERIRDFKSISLTPVLIGVKVLQVTKVEKKKDDVDSINRVSLILQLTRKQVATVTIARRIAELEVHLSTGERLPSELSADVGDVLSGYKAVREFRAETDTVR